MKCSKLIAYRALSAEVEPTPVNLVRFAKVGVSILITS